MHYTTARNSADVLFFIFNHISNVCMCVCVCVCVCGGGGGGGLKS